MQQEPEVALPGGRVTPGVVRVGATVRRPLGPHSPFVHDLLRYLEAVDFAGAPRLLGIDAQGREILTFLEGVIPDGTARLPDAQLVSATRLIARLHALTAGCALAHGAEIVGHGELGPHNTVYRGDSVASARPRYVVS
jgi:hypothetical protein